MEVEDEEQSCTFKYEGFILLVLERYVRLGGAQPLVHGLEVVQDLVEFVQVPVSEEWVVDQVELTSSVLERVPVTLSREVHPFGMAELVAFKVQVTFTAKSVTNESDHLVQRNASVDDWGELGEVGHVSVCGRVT